MRTIRVEIESPIPDATNPLSTIFGSVQKIRVSTEVIVPDETKEAAETAGHDARVAIDGFIEGYGGG